MSIATRHRVDAMLANRANGVPWGTSQRRLTSGAAGEIVSAAVDVPCGDAARLGNPG